MTGDGGQRGPAAAAPARDAVVPVVREFLSVVPAGATWLLPVTAADDFLVAAVSGEGNDIYGRGTARVGERLSELYPSMVDGPLWQLYHEVLASGEPGRLADFRYAEHRTGVVADSRFEVRV